MTELNNTPHSGMVIYTNPDNSVQLEVKLEQDTVWLTQKQIALLFDVKKAAISKHIANIYTQGELDKESTVSKMETVQTEGNRVIRRMVEYYNMDMILSVGYRVNSKNATAFRRWATQVLKDYLVKGYAINQNIQLQHYQELKDVVALMSRTLSLQERPSQDEYTGLFRVISDYVYALDTLDHYDYQQLTIGKTTHAEPFHATYENAMEAILALKEKFGGSALFANEKDESFRSQGEIWWQCPLCQ